MVARGRLDPEAHDPGRLTPEARARNQRLAAAERQARKAADRRAHALPWEDAYQEACLGILRGDRAFVAAGKSPEQLDGHALARANKVVRLLGWRASSHLGLTQYAIFKIRQHRRGKLDSRDDPAVAAVSARREQIGGEVVAAALVRDGEDPSEALILAEDLARLRAALTRLTETQRRAITLYFGLGSGPDGGPIEPMSLREIAAAMDPPVTHNAIKLAIDRGLKNLRKLMGVDDDDRRDVEAA